MSSLLPHALELQGMSFHRAMGQIVLEAVRWFARQRPTLKVKRENMFEKASAIQHSVTSASISWFGIAN